jgi:hypothetical protein
MTMHYISYFLFFLYALLGGADTVFLPINGRTLRE